MSTSYDPAPPADPETSHHHDLSAPQPDGNGAGALSSLDELRSAVEAAEQYVEVEFADHHLYAPGRVIRLTCSTELEQSEWKNIQLRALPHNQRRKRQPDIRKLNEIDALAGLIAHQTTSVAILQQDGEYKPLMERGEPLTFADPGLLAALGAAETFVAIRKVFGGSDAYLLDAGRELLEECGYGERRPGEDDDDADPQ